MTKYNDVKNCDWMNNLRDDALLNVRDVTEIFNYKNSTSIKSAVVRNQFPKPQKIRLFNGIERNFWKVEAIKQEIKRRKLLQNT